MFNARPLRISSQSTPHPPTPSIIGIVIIKPSLSHVTTACVLVFFFIRLLLLLLLLFTYATRASPRLVAHLGPADGRDVFTVRRHRARTRPAARVQNNSRYNCKSWRFHFLVGSRRSGRLLYGRFAYSIQLVLSKNSISVALFDDVSPEMYTPNVKNDTTAADRLPGILTNIIEFSGSKNLEIKII